MKEYGEVLESVDLKDYNTYRIGGIAKYIVKPFNIENLKKLINYLNKESIKYLVLGKGSNVILPDENYDGAIILLDNLNNVNINNNLVEVEAGIILSQFINKIIDEELGGLENLFGIPGTLGGAIVGNVGCYVNTISDYLESVTYLENNEIRTLKKEQCYFDYRNSIFKHDKNKIILSAKFKLYNSNKNIMRECLKENLTKRKNTQPLEYPNAGSVFRNLETVAAGKLIDDLGLKNYNVNGAYISEKHANFIINKDNAKSKDIVKLIEIIRDLVKQKYGFELILEQEIVKY